MIFTCTHQHGRPNHSVKPVDVLAHDVHVGWPESAERFRSIRAIDAAHVVDQGVKPNVHHVLLAINQLFRARNAPIEGAATDGEVPQLQGASRRQNGGIQCRPRSKHSSYQQLFFSGASCRIVGTAALQR